MQTNRGTIHGLMGDHLAAMEDYSAALQLAPLDVSILKNRAHAGVTANLYEDAWHDFSTLVGLSFPTRLACDPLFSSHWRCATVRERARGTLMVENLFLFVLCVRFGSWKCPTLHRPRNCMCDGEKHVPF